MVIFSAKNKKVALVTSILMLLLAGSSVASARTLREGDKGNDVAQMQNLLVRIGYKVVVDGSFGTNTLAAVKDFQKLQGLEVDGLVGTSTYGAMLQKAIPPETSRGKSDVSRRIVQYALEQLGVPYVWGGTTPRGFDCSGFVQYVYNKAGLSLPRCADTQYEVGQVISVNHLRPGDLVFFSTYEPGPSHVGIYLGDGNFVHASSNTGISITPLFTGYYGPRYIGARRL